MSSMLCFAWRLQPLACHEVIDRAEALLLEGKSCQRSGRAGTRIRRLGARVLGALARQAPGRASKWLTQLDASLVCG